jgi:hypothetical protein
MWVFSHSFLKQFAHIKAQSMIYPQKKIFYFSEDLPLKERYKYDITTKEQQIVPIEFSFTYLYVYSIGHSNTK